MSSLVAEPRPARPRGPAPAARTLPPLRDRNAAWLGAAIAAALAAVAFVGQGGLDRGSATAVEMGVTIAGAALVGAAIAVAPPLRRAWGGLTLALMAALTVLTAVSIAWSVQPDDSWLEANRTLSYLAAFAGGMALGRLAPRRWTALLGGVLAATVIVCGYGLITKVFPATLAAGQSFSRLSAPFGYWNALGLMAAMGIPPCLWLGSRRSGHPALAVLAYPAFGLLTVAMLLSYSRGALAAAGLGMVLWFALVPRRLRALAVALTGAGAGALVGLWAFGQHALSQSNVPLGARSSAGHELGWLLLALVAVLAAVGLAVGYLAERRPLEGRTRWRTGLAALVVVALVVLGVGTKLTVSPRGLTGSVSHAWGNLTNPEQVTQHVPIDSPNRLTTSASTVRAQYWSDAISVWREQRLRGAGAGGYATARMHVTTRPGLVRHAHGYVTQTLADLGLLGLGLSALLLVCWLGAAARPTAPRAGLRGAAAAERAGMVTLVATVLAFGVSSMVDWTWFVPGTTLLALLCAGWVAARGPLGAAVLVRGRPGRVRLGAAAAAVVLGLVGAWAIWQPQRAADAGGAALAAAQSGHYQAAMSHARDAAARDPLSLQPLFDQAGIQDAAGHPRAARATLQRAVRLQPANPLSWQQLGELELNRLGHPYAALTAFAAALYLGPQQVQAQQDYVAARARLQTAAAARVTAAARRQARAAIPPLLPSKMPGARLGGTGAGDALASGAQSIPALALASPPAPRATTVPAPQPKAR